MAFFFLNKLNKSLSKNEIANECKKYGKLKFVGNFQQDKKDKAFHSTVVDFIELTDEKGFLKFCKNKKILAIKRKGDSQAPKHSKENDRDKKKQFQISNPSFYFYKDKSYGKNIEHFSIDNFYEELFSFEDAQTFDLTTLYPGLLIGSGYNHPKLKENNDDFQLGFFFDHTTGLPIISGSSIKGLLKSVCKQEEFMQDIYDRQVPLAIFEDGKTIFYDAFIVSTANEERKIFGTDYITSHFSNEKDGMFKEPNPVKFLKILPQVTFKFQFQAPKEYVELFRKIILDFGLGAKTNVGYGKFIEEV